MCQKAPATSKSEKITLAIVELRWSEGRQAVSQSVENSIKYKKKLNSVATC